MIRRVAVRAVAVLLGLAAGLVAIETVLRALDLAPTEGVATVSDAQFRSVPGLLAPGQDVHDRRIPALAHRVRVNALGYRGSGFTRSKPAGETRVLMIGDSFTYGDFVDDGKTLPAYLERTLAPVCPGLRVINAGLGGTTIDSHVRMAERALPLGPDVAILTFSENDLDDLDQPSIWDRLAANRELKSGFPLVLLYPALSRLALWHFALDARLRLRDRLAANASGPDVMSEAWRAGRRAARKRQLGAYAGVLTALRDRLASHGIAFVLALFPSHLSLREDGSAEQLEWLAAAGRAAGIMTVDLLPPLRESGEPIDRLYLLPHDGHPAARAYEIAAGALAEKLVLRRMLPCRPPDAVPAA